MIVGVRTSYNIDKCALVTAVTSLRYALGSASHNLLNILNIKIKSREGFCIPGGGDGSTNIIRKQHSENKRENGPVA